MGDSIHVSTPHTPAAKFRLALLLIFLGGVLLAPVWLVEFPPLVDYPNHLARTFVLAHLHDPAYDFGTFYSSDWNLYPYLTMDVALLGLQRVFPAELAGRIFLSLCLLATPLAAWFFVRQANPGSEPLALFTLLLAYNNFFLLGFLSFYLSLAFCFLAAGLWLRDLEKPGVARWILACAGVTALYFTHLLGFAIAFLMMAVFAVFERRKPRELLRSGLLFLPGAACYLYVMRTAPSPKGEFVFHTLGEKLEGMVALAQGYSPHLDYVTLAALALCALAAAWRNTECRWNRRWWGVALALFLAYWALPQGIGDGWDFDTRVLPVLLVVLLVTVKVGARARRIAAVAVLLFVVRTVDVAQNFFNAQPELAGLAESFAAAPQDASVLPIVEAEPDDDPLSHSFAHFWAYGVIRRGWITPYLFDIRGVTPLRFTGEVYTHDGFWDLAYEAAPDWEAVQRDYDLVWAYHVPRFSPQLDEIGDLIYADGELEVYALESDDEQDTPAQGMRAAAARDSLHRVVFPLQCAAWPTNSTSKWKTARARGTAWRASKGS